MYTPNDKPKEYNVSVSSDNIHDAIASVGSALYALVEEALATHEDHEMEECEFESFARDIIGVLTQHPEQLSADEVSWETCSTDELSYD